MNSPRIGQVIYTVGSSCIGITMLALSAYQCQGISKSSCRNTNIKCQRNRSIVRTLQLRNNKELQHKPHSSQTFPQSYQTSRSRKYNESSEAFCITHVWSTSPSSWHLAPLQANKQGLPRIRWPKQNNFWITLRHTPMRP